MSDLTSQYLQKSKKHVLLIALLSVVTVLFAVYSMGTGSSSNLGFWSTLKIILGLETGSELQTAIIWKLRFPRVLMAIVGGTALATAGALMQGALGNPLVSPLTMGVASGAALGAALAIVLGWTLIDNSDLRLFSMPSCFP